MTLFEEYFQRHGITDVPVARHCKESSLLLKNGPSKWELLNFSYIVDDSHPSKYRILTFHPIHDGYRIDKVFGVNSYAAVWKGWHEYEDFCLDPKQYIKEGYEPVHPDEVLAVSWQIFVHAYDGWFCRQSAEVKQTLFESLDDDLPVDVRRGKYQEIVFFLSTHHPAVMSAWKYEVLGKLQNYADWLVDYVLQKKEASESLLVLEA